MTWLERDITQTPNRDIRNTDGTILITKFAIILLPYDMDTGTFGRF